MLREDVVSGGPRTSQYLHPVLKGHFLICLFSVFGDKDEKWEIFILRFKSIYSNFGSILFAPPPSLVGLYLLRPQVHVLL